MGNETTNILQIMEELFFPFRVKEIEIPNIRGRTLYNYQIFASVGSSTVGMEITHKIFENIKNKDTLAELVKDMKEKLDYGIRRVIIEDHYKDIVTNDIFDEMGNHVRVDPLCPEGTMIRIVHPTEFNKLKGDAQISFKKANPKR